MPFFKLRRLARKAGREALILFFAVRHPDTPLPLKVAAVAALAYLLSPIDLIPDVPLVGFVDDLLVLSLGLPMLVRRLPSRVVADAGTRADKVLSTMGFGKTAAADAGRGDVEVEIGTPVRRTARTADPAKPGVRRRTGSSRVSDAKIVSESRRPARERPDASAPG